MTGSRVCRVNAVGLRGLFLLTGLGRSRFLLAVATAAFAMLAWACAESSPELDALEAEDAYSRGLELREQGQMRNAFDEFNVALSLNPRYAEAYSARASIYYAFGDETKTITDLNQALRLDPEIAEAYYYRGLIFIAKGDSDSAVINLTRALQIDPEHTDAYFNRARVYFALQDIDAALGDLTSAVEIEDGSAQLYFLRGQVYLVAGETEKGLADIERTLELTDDDALTARAKELLSTIR